MNNITRPHRIAVVIPAYRVKSHVLEVITAIGPEVWRIFVIDDACPESTGDFVQAHCRDARVEILRLPQNLGVGGAVMAGYRAGLEAGADVLVKIDGDGQMDPRLINQFVLPIRQGRADYTKGNRFFSPEMLAGMPVLRLLGNAVLSLVNKISSGYWDIFDPTNGYTAIHARTLALLPLGKISRRYFFESDMLFRLNTLRALVVDIPMHAVYGNETSHLRVQKILIEFLFKHIRNFVKRIFYNYYLRDMSIASFELPIGLFLILSGILYGGMNWLYYDSMNVSAPTGTIVLPAMSILAGLQLVLAFIQYDIANVPRTALHLLISDVRVHPPGDYGGPSA